MGWSVAVGDVVEVSEQLLLGACLCSCTLLGRCLASRMRRCAVVQDSRL